MTRTVIASIAIAVCNDLRVERLLLSLNYQTMPFDKFEVILIENGSYLLCNKDFDYKYKVSYMSIARRNMAAARNEALRIAKGKYFLMTDADVIASETWVQNMVNALEKNSVVGVGGRIKKYKANNWIQRKTKTIVGGQKELNYLPALDLPYVVGVNAGFLLEELRKVGGFDKCLLSGNDVDICYKIGLAGGSLMIEDDAIVYHEDRASLYAHFNRYRQYAYYQVLLFSKYRQISRKKFILNTYPFDRIIEAMAVFPRSVYYLTKGNVELLQESLLLTIEAFGIWVGDIQGSIRFREFYI